MKGWCIYPEKAVTLEGQSFKDRYCIQLLVICIKYIKYVQLISMKPCNGVTIRVSTVFSARNERVAKSN